MNLHDWYKRVDIASQQAARQRGPAQPPALSQEAQTTIGERSASLIGTDALTETAPERPPKKTAKSREGRSRKPSLRRIEGESGTAAMSTETREQLLSRLLDPILSLEEAAKVLNVCPTTVRRYTNSGALAHLRTQGNQRRFLLSDVLAFLKSQEGAKERTSPGLSIVTRRRRAYPESASSSAELERGS